MSKKPNPEIMLLVEIIERAYNKQSWHGTNLRGSLRGLTIAQLIWRPGPKRHNCWEIALHTAYWKYAVFRRLTGSDKGSFPRTPSDWPRMPSKHDQKSWRSDLALLEKYHGLLLNSVKDLPPVKLNRLLPKSKLPYRQIIYGVASHDIYHAGQIQLLKRLYKTR